MRLKIDAVGIFGIGEVGTAVLELLKSANIPYEIHDPKVGYHSNFSNCSIIHHCTPAEVVDANVRKHRRKIHIIHSTVAPGTCRRLALDGYIVYHVPVNGKHPNLKKSLLIFDAMLGCGNKDTPTTDKLVQDYLRLIGIETSIVHGWENTELAKILCTTRLGLDVLYMRHVAELCKKYGADFETVYTKWTNIYNEGYWIMGMPQYTRPILNLQKGKIGGHCVVNNAKHLKDDSWVAALIVNEEGKDWQI